MFLVPLTRSSFPASRTVDRLFDDAFDRFFVRSIPAARPPALDVAETDAEYTVRLDAPGIAKDDVTISVDGRRVTVEARSAKDTAGKDGERLVYRERAASSWTRSLTLPAEVDEAASSAKLEHGVLTLTLAKKQPAQPRRITVN